jgi:hypothetical protein
MTSQSSEPTKGLGLGYLVRQSQRREAAKGDEVSSTDDVRTRLWAIAAFAVSLAVDELERYRGEPVPIEVLTELSPFGKELVQQSARIAEMNGVLEDSHATNQLTLTGRARTLLEREDYIALLHDLGRY